MEFKRLSDVEVVAEPTESANVLIEEDGVIKKAPKTAVGGNSKWDAVIEYVYTDDDNYVNLVSGDCMTVGNKIMNDGEAPNIMIRSQTQYGDIAYGAEKANAVYVVGNSIKIGYPTTPMLNGDGRWFTWNQDNTITM